MRLTCPNCGAEYDVPEGLVPPAGRHVQCTACHTRWFMRGPAREELSEDEILSKLETRGARPSAPAAESPPSPPPAGAGAGAPAPIPFPRAAKPGPVEAAPAAKDAAAPAPEPSAPIPAAAEPVTPEPVVSEPAAPEPAAPAPAVSEPSLPDRLPPPAPDPAPAPVAESAARRLPGEAAPGLVNLRPAAGPESEAAKAVPAGVSPREEAALSVPAREAAPPPDPRSTPRPRLDVAEAHAAPPPPVRRGRGFLPGFILALLIAGLAFEIYFWRDPLAAQLPAAAPVIHGYADGVDAAREWLRDRLEAAGLAGQG